MSVCECVLCTFVATVVELQLKLTRPLPPPPPPPPLQWFRCIYYSLLFNSQSDDALSLSIYTAPSTPVTELSGVGSGSFIILASSCLSLAFSYKSVCRWLSLFSLHAPSPTGYSLCLSLSQSVFVCLVDVQTVAVVVVIKSPLALGQTCRRGVG